MPRNRKGFTLAELLIVVAIIAVLTTIFMAQYVSTLERSREAAELSDIRSAFVEVVNHYVSDQEIITKTVKVQQKGEGWQPESDASLQFSGGGIGTYTISAKTEGEYTITIKIDPETGDIVPVIS